MTGAKKKGEEAQGYQKQSKNFHILYHTTFLYPHTSYPIRHGIASFPSL
jgi:hypothetical protein